MPNVLSKPSKRGQLAGPIIEEEFPEQYSNPFVEQWCKRGFNVLQLPANEVVLDVEPPLVLEGVPISGYFALIGGP